MAYYVYVIELDKEVAKSNKFRKQSPHYLYGNRCFYVGQSAKAPLLRFKQHKEGYKSNTFARRFGLRLVPKFYEKYNPIPTRKDAEELEEYLSNKLRELRYGVWSN
jgi:hypothetical protein